MPIIKFLRNIVYFVLSIIVLGLLSEVYLQTGYIVSPATTDFDPAIGRVKRANMSYLLFNEGLSMGKINEYGYLGPARGYEKPGNTIRIALIGDSFVEGYQVFDRHHFRSIMEENLNQYSAVNYEVLNFGRSGFNLADMYAYYHNYIKNFNPDILFFFISREDLNPLQTDPINPKVRVSDDSVYIDMDSYSPGYLKSYTRLKFLTMNFSIMQMVNNSRKLVKEGLLAPKLLDKAYDWIYGAEMLPNAPENTSTSNYELDELVLAIIKSLSIEEGLYVINRDNIPFPDNLTKALADYSIPKMDVNDTLNCLRLKGIDPTKWSIGEKSGHWNHSAHQAIGQYLSHKLQESR